MLNYLALGTRPKSNRCQMTRYDVVDIGNRTAPSRLVWRVANGCERLGPAGHLPPRRVR